MKGISWRQPFVALAREVSSPPEHALPYSAQTRYQSLLETHKDNEMGQQAMREVAVPLESKVNINDCRKT